MSKNILVVDDSATVREVLDLILTDAGYTVSLATDGVAALDMVGTGDYDLLMTDLNMPKKDGISFISEVRKMPGRRFTPIIILSGDLRESRKQECIAAGASCYLQKPFKQEQVLGILGMLVPLCSM